MVKRHIAAVQAPGAGRAGNALLAIFISAVFVSALLLFLVQPMVGRMVLPRLGGSPAVWNTCMVFFQALLLAGYLYAHILSRLPERAQVFIHAAALMTPLIALPLRLRDGLVSAGEDQPVTWLLMVLAVSAGPPVLALASTGPLLQRWFSRTAHRDAHDPYFLYAASNAGSMLALLAYPTLVEPLLGLTRQRAVWSGGYLVFALLVGMCGVAMLLYSARSRAPRGAEASPTLPGPLAAAPEDAPAHAAPSAAWGGWSERLWWVLLAFVPSSLMLGATQYITTDIAAVPLLWVIPLAIYLLTFILAFSRRQVFPVESAAKLLPIVVLAVAVTFFQPTRTISLLVHLIALTVAAMLCHGRLAARRPHPAYLTEFYLWIAVGGVLGGVFTSLVAPHIFSRIVEYPIAIALACLVRPPGESAGERPRHAGHWRIVDFAAPVVLLLLLKFLPDAMVVLQLNVEFGRILLMVIPLAVCLLFVRRRLGFALAIGATLLGQTYRIGAAPPLLRERTFFGVYAVTADRAGHKHTLSHGTTQHGNQWTKPPLSLKPTTYFHPTGPIGDLFRAVYDDETYSSFAMVGLGAGSMAAYARPGHRMDFYEIDPAVKRIAENERLFTYVRDARALGGEINVIVGDARLTLARVPDGHYDIIVLDAFTSDAIPIHLLTREAVEMYFDKLRKGGLLAFHISNKYLDLAPVLAAAARDLRLLPLLRNDQEIEPGWAQEGREVSLWMILARLDDMPIPALDPIGESRQWLIIEPLPGTRAWTDDYSNVIGRLIWH